MQASRQGAPAHAVCEQRVKYAHLHQLVAERMATQALAEVAQQLDVAAEVLDA